MMVDGVDLAQRLAARQVAVVNAGQYTFNRTIHEDIALGDPGMLCARGESRKSDGADEFVAELPRGDETMIEECDANLSGQRQRIAIARALAANRAF
jgi:ATP-binding cassette, subfamily B, bacterial HlyB/CyaB